MNDESGAPDGKARMLPTDRIAYSAITERAAAALPDGARMVVWVIVNVEEWDPTQPMPRTVLTPPAGGSSIPDIPNWAWHEYGNRVGFWRLLEVFDELEMPACWRSTARRSRLRADRRALRSSAAGSSWATASRRRTCRRSRTSAKTSSRRARRSAQSTGKPPRGWLGPGLTETWETPDLLVEEGFDYVADWVLDDQPVRLKTRTKPIVSVPYTQECNDVAMMLIQHHVAQEYRRPRASTSSSRSTPTSANSARVMALVRASLHHGRAAPVQILPPRARAHARRSAMCCSGPANRSSTGSCRSGRRASVTPATVPSPHWRTRCRRCAPRRRLAGAPAHAP